MNMWILKYIYNIIYNIYIYINKIIYEHVDFKTGTTTNNLVSHNIFTNHNFVFQNSAIFVFIHDKIKRRIIETCFIALYNTIPQYVFFKMLPSIGK